MKTLKPIGTILFLSLILSAMTSCSVGAGLHTNIGRHKAEAQLREMRKHTVVYVAVDKQHRYTCNY
jgi:hypothetical protein